MSFTYEVNLSCDEPQCMELICTEILTEVSLQELLVFAEENQWRVTAKGMYCPEHGGGEPT